MPNFYPIYNRLSELNACIYGGSMDAYLKNKECYQACVIYEQLVKNPEVRAKLRFPNLTWIK